MQKQYSGTFITIEGGDGSGKTTICKQIVAKFNNAILTHEPSSLPLSKTLRKIILDPKDENNISGRSELFLYLAARIENVEKVI